MSVEDSNAIDLVEIHPGAVLLVISDHLDWFEEEAHARLLRAKIHRYLDFARSGELLEGFPDAGGRKVFILIRAMHPATGYASRFLADISIAVMESGCRLQLVHRHR
jgi:hypothetical protein